MGAYQKEEDRNSKRALKAMDVLADLLKAQESNDLETAKISAQLLADVLKQQGNQ
jgi:flagellar biosynthesis/type III secretory pathway ATPase